MIFYRSSLMNLVGIWKESRYTTTSGHPSIYGHNCACNEWLNKEANEDEIQQAINQISLLKTPALDCMHATSIKNADI